jgi:hypothetical protein
MSGPFSPNAAALFPVAVSLPRSVQPIPFAQSLSKGLPFAPGLRQAQPEQNPDKPKSVGACSAFLAFPATPNRAGSALHEPMPQFIDPSLRAQRSNPAPLLFCDKANTESLDCFFAALLAMTNFKAVPRFGRQG